MRGSRAADRLEYEGKVGWTDGLRWMVDWSSRSLPVVDRSFIRWTRGYRWILRSIVRT